MESSSTKELQKQLGVENVHAVPRVTKVVVTVGVGKHRDDKAYIAAVEKDLATITGQKPAPRKAKKAIAGFKVRQNDLVGYQVTLRGKRMEDFLSRFVNITLPRVRDFRGLPSTSFDRTGNVTVGVKEHLAFPEIQADKTDVMFGVQVTCTTTATNKEEAQKLFAVLGFPFIGAKEDEGLPSAV